MDSAMLCFSVRVTLAVISGCAALDHGYWGPLTVSGQLTLVAARQDFDSRFTLSNINVKIAKSGVFRLRGCLGRGPLCCWLLIARPCVCVAIVPSARRAKVTCDYTQMQIDGELRIGHANVSVRLPLPVCLSVACLAVACARMSSPACNARPRLS